MNRFQASECCSRFQAMDIKVSKGQQLNRKWRSGFQEVGLCHVRWKPGSSRPF